MKFQIAFDQTGDTIPFISLNDQILEFYVDYLTVQNLNSFELLSPQTSVDMSEKIHSLNDTIKKNNALLKILLDRPMEMVEDLEYLDQLRLSKYHADWVNTLRLDILYDIDAKRQQYNYTGLVEKIHNLFPDDIRHPAVSTVLLRLGYKNIHDKINFDIHDIEDLFNQVDYKVKNQDWVAVENPFLHQGLNHHRANFKLSFHHPGRTLYNKFLYQDNVVDITEHNDENNYRELLGFVDLNLLPPESIEMSPEYIKWCRAQNRVPLGHYLNLGNIPDLAKHLTDYRIVIYRNALKNNSFSIQLT